MTTKSNRPKPIQNFYIRDDRNGYVPIITDHAVVMGAEGEHNLVVHVLGEPNLNQLLDTVMSGIYHICKMGVASGGDKAQIYTVAVQAFSLIMDKFMPESKDFTRGIMTDDELQALEDSVKKQ